MGKKIKKDEKPTADDTFETVSIDSTQPSTVVLMLDSPEEEVQAKACEAVYKFADKCDDNKKGMLDLGAVTKLLKLLQSEDRIVRRNACSAIGVLAAHPDVRKMLRKQDDAIPAVLALLNPEEDSVIHEFAALWLSHMSAEYSSKVAIFEQGGLEPLVRCVAANDPDVQKNALEAIAQLLLDYQARSAIRDCDGLRPILELLKSEFAIIQQLALLALDRAAQDAENRAALRELEAITKLVDFVAHPEWNDLHVQSVQVLASLLEDNESLEIIKQTGGLKKLVALITDQPPPDDGGKAESRDKKSVSRAGKKSASKDGKKPPKDEDRGETPFGENIIPTLPDVKTSAAKAIGRSAKNADNRKILHEQETEKMLIHLLSNDVTDVQIAAAQALGVMSENLMSKDSIREWEGFPALVKQLHNDNPEVKEAATFALANLTTANLNNCQELLNLNGLDCLITLLAATNKEQTIAHAAIILTNLAQDEGIRSDAQGKGVVTALIEPLKSGCTTVQSKTSLAVAAFVCDADSRAEFRNSSGLQSLVPLLNSPHDEVRRNASWAITVCAGDEPTAIEISNLGGLEILQEIQLSTARRNAFAQAALEKLLDSNLAAKYSLTGRLSSGDLIADGFFDAGQMKPGTKFLPLKDYCDLALNEKRAILLINAKPDPNITPPTESELVPATSKISVSGKSSRTGHASKSKNKTQREKDEKTKDELQAQLQKELEADGEGSTQSRVPPDPMLLKYVEEVTEKIQPLNTSREQVVALARYVSDKMGGPIEKGQVANFSWELPISQVKFDLKSNVVPLGKIKTGIFIHRALLFKALADRIAVGCSLVRGDYNRAWNDVLLPDETDKATQPKFPPKSYIVDLVHHPGALLRTDSPDAVSYQRL